MKQNWSRVITVFVAMFVAVFMASSAMAATNVTTMSAEMDDFSECDRAGTIMYTFDAADLAEIQAYLNGPDGAPGGGDDRDYAMIRIALNGTDLPANPALPTLCKDIHGTADVVGNAGNFLPYCGDAETEDDLVALQNINVEVSDMSTDGVADIVAYVHGNEDDQYIELYIISVDLAETDPWLKIGLYEELVPGETTEICAKVVSFSGISKLTISNQAWPTTLTFTGDNEIGHFLAQRVIIRDCEKDENCLNKNTEIIPLCSLDEQEDCGTYYKCFVADGDFPINEEMVINIRTNGADCDDNTQEGVYFRSIDVFDEDGNVIAALVDGNWVYYEADCSTGADAGCDFEAKNAYISFNTSAFSGDELRFCVVYTVDPNVAVADTKVRLWVEMHALPCGAILSGMNEAADLVECGMMPSCMYFPYVLTDCSPWMTGLVVTNLSSDVSIANMEVTFTLTDSTGAEFTYTKSDFASKVWSFTLDSVLTDWGWTPMPGNAWLNVETNFTVDGYEFLTDGVFGAGTQPRLDINCDGDASCD